MGAQKWQGQLPAFADYPATEAFVRLLPLDEVLLHGTVCAASLWDFSAKVCRV